MRKYRTTKLEFLNFDDASKDTLSLNQFDAFVEREAFFRIEKRPRGPIASDPEPVKVKPCKVKKASPKKRG